MSDDNSFIFTSHDYSVDLYKFHILIIWISLDRNDYEFVFDSKYDLQTDDGTDLRLHSALFCSMTASH